MRWFLRSKIHNATVTDARVDYVGSITIDEALVEKAGMKEGEKVLVVDNTNGARVETYVILGERDSGVIQTNGAAAHLIKAGDQVIIMGFELAEDTIEAKNILVDEDNKFSLYL
jgi:aspartate 1-decarboxylase